MSFNLRCLDLTIATKARKRSTERSLSAISNATASVPRSHQKMLAIDLLLLARPSPTDASHLWRGRLLATLLAFRPFSPSPERGKSGGRGGRGTDAVAFDTVEGGPAVAQRPAFVTVVRSPAVYLLLLLFVLGCPKNKPSTEQPDAQPTKQTTTTSAPSTPDVPKVSFPNDEAPTFSLSPFLGVAPLSLPSVGALWTVDFENAFLLAVEPKTGKLLGKAQTWPRPHDILLSPDGKRVWVSAVGVEDDAGEGGVDAPEQSNLTPGSDNGEIWIYNSETLEIVQKLKPGRYPGHLAARPDGSYLFASLAGDDAVAVIDARQMTVLGRLPVAKGPRGLSVSPDGKRLAVACSKAGVVSVINLSTLTREFEIPVGDRPTQVAFSLDSKTAYVTVLDSSSLKAINLEEQKISWQVEVSYGMGHIAVSPADGNVYIADGATNSLVIVEPKTQQKVASWYAGNGAHAVALSLDQKTSYVTVGTDKAIAEVAQSDQPGVLSTGGLLRGIAIGPAPKMASIATEQPKITQAPKPTADEAKIKYGRSVFKKNCDPCHPQGKQKVGPQIKGKNLSKKRIVNQVRNGSDIMPSFEADILSAAELEAIVAYLQAP